VKSRILQSVVPILLVVSFTPALCRAQAEINPDHFESVGTAAALEHKASSNANPSRAYGSFFLPYDVSCAGATLTRGYYSLSVRQSGRQDVVRLTPVANGVRAQAIEVTATPRLSPGAPNGLLVGRVNQRRTLTAIRLGQPGVTLFLQTGKATGASMLTELIPMSSSSGGVVPAGGN
jgi:hypothetical protein